MNLDRSLAQLPTTAKHEKFDWSIYDPREGFGRVAPYTNQVAGRQQHEHSWIRLKPYRPHTNLDLPPMGTCVARHTDLRAA